MAVTVAIGSAAGRAVKNSTASYVEKLNRISKPS